MARRNTNHRHENTVKYFIKILSEHHFSRERFETLMTSRNFGDSTDIHSVPVGFQTYNTSNYTAYNTVLTNAVELSSPIFLSTDAMVPPETD